MIRSQLNSYSGADPIWGFVALIGNERYTGEVAVGIDPRVRLFAVDGRVYFAEREGDAPIGTRLVSCGVVSTTQLEAGGVQIGDTTSLARLFQRQPSIDRDAVELTIELATESLLESIANKAVGMPEVFPLRHHSSGVHHWLRDSAAATSLPVAEAFATAAPADDSRLIEAVTLEEEAAVEEAAVEEAAVEEAIPVEEAVAVEEAVIEEDAVEEAVVEEAVVEEAFIYEAVSEELVAEKAVIEETIPDEPVIEDAIVEETIPDEPVIEELVVVPAPVFVLPTLSSLLSPAAEDDQDATVHIEEIQPVDLADETVTDETVTDETVTDETVTDETVTDETVASVEAVIVEEPASEVAPVTALMLAPIPTLASLTLPILHTMSAPLPEPEPLVATEPAIASTADNFFASLPEQPTYIPVHPFVLVEPPADLPRLASAPTSTIDLVVNPAPLVTFGEPTHNLAAVDIWELVDVLTDDRRDAQQELVGSGDSDKRGRSWLRGKKG